MRKLIQTTFGIAVLALCAACGDTGPQMITTDSGLQVEVLRQGDGASPTIDDDVVLHYRGTLTDGSQFDSSYDRGEPATFPVSGVIEGFGEAVQLMSVGGHIRVTIPSAMAYGEDGAGAVIGPNEDLIFEIELLEIVGS